GTSAAIAVRGLTVTALTPSPSGFSATFSKPFNPAVLNLYDAGGAFGPPDVTLVLGASTTIKGTLVLNSTNTRFTFRKTGSALAAGTYTVPLVSGTSAFVDQSGVPLDGNGDGTPGDNFVTTFTVTTPPVTVSVPDFARGPAAGQNINLINNTTNGVPI